MPTKDRTVVQYIVRHPEGMDARIRACVHFITYGKSYGKTEVYNFDGDLTLDLTNHRPPPHDLLDRLTGQDRELADSFFSIRENQSAYHEAWARLWNKMGSVEQGGCVAFLINCTMGRHRSVAMAERLAKKVGSLDDFRAECLHLDLGRARIEQAEKASERSQDEPSQGRARSRHRTQEASDIRVGEMRTRRAATTTNSMLSPREAPLREKRVSWPTRLTGEKYPQQRDTAGRSIGSWRESEI